MFALAVGRWIRRKGLIVLVLALGLALSIVGIALAWDPTFPGAPYTGLYRLASSDPRQVPSAEYIRWTSSGVAAMRSDSNPRFDMTADCTPDNPGEDQLNYAAAFTDIPNNGLDVWSDCGVFWVREEVELKINAGSVAAETNYYYQVHYDKNKTGVCGAINLTYQRDNSPTHDWLDKVNYCN